MAGSSQVTSHADYPSAAFCTNGNRLLVQCGRKTDFESSVYHLNRMNYDIRTILMEFRNGRHAPFQ